MPYSMENRIKIGSDSGLLSDIIKPLPKVMLIFTSVASCGIYFWLISQTMTKISTNHQYALEYQTFKIADMYLQAQWVKNMMQVKCMRVWY